MSASATAAVSATVCDLFVATARARGGKLALRSADGRARVTWGEYAERAREGAGGLAGLRVGHGDTVACWLSNRPEFHIADVAAMHLGAVPFSVCPAFTADEAGHVIADAGSRVLITERAFLEPAMAVREGGRTSIESIVLVDGADARALTWEELLDCAPSGFDFAATAARVVPDDSATLIYPADTTAAMKGVQVTHRNIVSQLSGLQQRLGLPGGLRAISWLPMAHIAERLCTHYFPIARGWEVTTCSDSRAVAALLRDVHPGFFFSPPELWEELRSGVLSAIDDAERADLEHAVARVRAGHGLQDGKLASAIRARLGFPELKVAIVGVAPCAREVIEFFHAIGVPLGQIDAEPWLHMGEVGMFDDDGCLRTPVI